MSRTAKEPRDTSREECWRSMRRICTTGDVAHQHTP